MTVTKGYQAQWCKLCTVQHQGGLFTWAATTTNDPAASQLTSVIFEVKRDGRSLP